MSLIRPWWKALVSLVFPEPDPCPLCHIQPLPEGLPVCFTCVERLDLSWHQLILSQYSAYALGYYQGYLKELLQQIKYHNAYDPAVVLGQILGLAAREQPELQDVDAFLPVPLHENRLRQRGFNQAEAFVAGMNLVWPHPTVSVYRLKDTAPQSQLSPEQRWQNLRGAFMLPNPSQILGNKILIIDDIFTTGATYCTLANLVSQHHGIPVGLFVAHTQSG